MRPPTAPVPDYSWLPPRKKDINYEFAESQFTRTGYRPNEYHINPEWVSEETHAFKPYQTRRYKPWAYEFQGARYYPQGTVERKIEEEYCAREMLEAGPCPQEEHPAATASEREAYLARLRLFTLETHPPWWPRSGRDREPAQHPHNQPTGAGAYSRYLNRPPPHVAQSWPNSSSLVDVSHTQLPGCGGRPGVVGLSARDPMCYLSSPPCPRQRLESTLISKSARYLPGGGDRPRFDRPYQNFVNAMWTPTDRFAVY